MNGVFGPALCGVGDKKPRCRKQAVTLYRVEEAGKASLVGESDRFAEEVRLGDCVVEPGFTATLNEVQSQFSCEGCCSRGDLGLQRKRRRTIRYRIEQLLCGEVESSKFFGRHHPDRKARCCERALHKHTVEFNLNESPEVGDER